MINKMARKTRSFKSHLGKSDHNTIAMVSVGLVSRCPGSKSFYPNKT